RHLRVERRDLRQVADAPLDLVGLLEDVEPRDLHRPARRGKVAGEDPHGGGLPGAVRAEEAEDLSLRHGEGEVLHRDPVAVPLAEPGDLDHRRHWTVVHRERARDTMEGHPSVNTRRALVPSLARPVHCSCNVTPPEISIVVQKYGGSSVADVERIRKVAARVAARRADGHQLVVVVSAMGDTTAELLSLAKKVSAAPPPPHPTH